MARSTIGQTEQQSATPDFESAERNAPIGTGMFNIGLLVGLLCGVFFGAAHERQAANKRLALQLLHSPPVSDRQAGLEKERRY